MREIKFRAWSLGKMLSHDELRDYEDAEPGILFNMFDDAYEGTVIMQYTGLKDKNGVEIYEGDITPVGVVEWACGRYWVGDSQNIDEIHRVVEVIGNIHENPELLNKV